MTPDFNRSENCTANVADNSTGGMLHYLNFNDRYNVRYAIYASSNEGMRFYDLRDPYAPKQFAYYHKEDHIAAKAPQGHVFANYQNGDAGCADTGPHACETNFPSEVDFTRPDPRYDTENCFWYSGWNQGGLVSMELTDPEYNPCMRKAVKAKGKFMDPKKGKKKVDFSVNAKRSNGGRGSLDGSITVNDSANNALISINKLTLLGGVRDACAPITSRASAVQIEGTGTYNGRDASFRVCVQEANAEGFRNHAERIHVACTAGCAYETGGELVSGNVSVSPRD